MARPRVFISSTYFDLKAIRAELNRFVLDQGYEPVEHEQGQIPYGSRERLENYCYQEIGFCDILVSVVGGRFGTPSAESEQYSISQMELKTAHRSGKQVYIFVERDVLAEYRTFTRNRDSTAIRYASVDDVRIFQFLDEIHRLPRNNPVSPFETGGDIIRALQDQWAGLFQRLLQREAQSKEIQLLQELREATHELRGIARELRSDRSPYPKLPRRGRPILLRLKEHLGLAYEPAIRDLTELNNFLEDHGYVSAMPKGQDTVFYFWRGQQQNLFVSKSLLDARGCLVEMDPSAWDDILLQWVPAQQDWPAPFPPDGKRIGQEFKAKKQTANKSAGGEKH